MIYDLRFSNFDLMPGIGVSGLESKASSLIEKCDPWVYKSQIKNQKSLIINHSGV